MARVLSGVSEPIEPDPELGICITVPEEFAGLSMGELNSRRGGVTGMDVQSGMVLIRGFLLASEYVGLEIAIAAGTQHRGRVEHAPRQ